MSTDPLPELGLSPAEVPALPAPARNALVSYLLHWHHFREAVDCLEALLAHRGPLVTFLDRLAEAQLALGDSQAALATMAHRHDQRVSFSSRVLEAQALLAADMLDLAATAIAELATEQPPRQQPFALEADLQLARSDPDAAEATLRRAETLWSDSPALGAAFARVSLARGDEDNALIWARTALARAEATGREPPIYLLRLLNDLQERTGNEAQARDLAQRLSERQAHEWEALVRALADVGLAPSPQPTALSEAAPPAPPELASAIQLAPDERAPLDQALKRHFPHDRFLPGQAEVISSILRGQSTLAVMPTGAGKSLCYQLAALLLPSTTLVLSPLIALMKDQLDGLPPEVAARATEINHTLEGTELDRRLDGLARGAYKLIYVAPERLRQRPFLHALARAGVSLLVIDEAHCVSLWGHDFRPDYLFIANAWHELGQPAVLAMTATATPRVQDDIRAALCPLQLVATSVDRPNLRFEAYSFANKREKEQQLVSLCRQLEGSGIVYARSRADCEALAVRLRSRGVSALHYHAGIDDRSAAQDRFMSGQTRVVVATIAFGMGIDKADVRFIIHFNPPKALENYYQEAGRAGRDGLPARCILFHSSADWAALARYARQEALELSFLRQVYAAIRRRLGTARQGLVATADLERDLGQDETPVRVAVQFLETAGLLWRGFDLPRSASLSLLRPLDGEEPDLARFVEAARLPVGQTVTRDLISLALDSALDPADVEAQVLAWQDAGWLGYRGAGRDMLLALPSPPPDSEQRVTAMLADYQAGYQARAAEMATYARVSTCRHGHISAYFAGQPIERCQSCDNCLSLRPLAPLPARPARPTPTRPPLEGDPASIILAGVQRLPFPMGRPGLSRALQGASSSTVRADRFPLFGALSGHTQKSIAETISALVSEGDLEFYERDGYRLLRLTGQGKAHLAATPTVDRPPTAVPEAAAHPSLQAPPATGRTPTTSPPRHEPQSPHPHAASHPHGGSKPGLAADLGAADDQEALAERLRAWRLDLARQIGQPPYMILSNAVLDSIAAARPSTPGELLAIRGIGPHKLEQYGPALLAIVAGREPPAA